MKLVRFNLTEKKWGQQKLTRLLLGLANAPQFALFPRPLLLIIAAVSAVTSEDEDEEVAIQCGRTD